MWGEDTRISLFGLSNILNLMCSTSAPSLACVVKYAGFGAGIRRRRAVSSEHRVRCQGETGNAAEHGAVRLSTCPLECWDGDMSAVFRF